MRTQRIIKLLTVFLICLMIGCIHTYAENPIKENGTLNEKQKAKINELYDYITQMKNEYEIIKDIDPKSYVEIYLKSGQSSLEVNKILSYGLKYIFREVSTSLNLIISMLIICIVCALLKNLHDSFHSGDISEIAYFACYSLIIVLIGKSFYIGIDVAREAIIRLTDFMAALMPVLLMLLASVGGFTQATLMDPIVMATTNICARIIADFIIPMIMFSFVLKFVNNLSKDEKVSNLSSLLNQIALWAQGFMLTVFVGVITVRSISSKAMDEVAIKTAKFAVDKFVPFVGKSLSDAFSTIAGYSLLIKNAIGTLGLVIILIIVLLPIIKLLIMAFIFKISAALIEPISEGRVIKCIGAAGDSLLLIMSCVLVVSVMCFIMIAIITGTGNSILAV